MVGVCEVPDLLASIGQSSRYIIILAPRLSCYEISESLQSQCCGHLYYRGDGVPLEQGVCVSFQFSGVRICTAGRSSHGSGSQSTNWYWV